MAKDDTRSTQTVAVSGTTGAGLVLLSVALPELLEDAPEWVAYAVFGLGLAFLLIALAAYLWGDRIAAKFAKRRMRRADLPIEITPREVTFDEAWDEEANDRIPFIRLRDIARDNGLDLMRGSDPARAANLAYRIEGALRQAAVDGKLNVWGRKYRDTGKGSNEPLVPIPASHFQDYEFRHGNLHYETDNEQSRTSTIKLAGQGFEGLPGVTYYDLQLSLSGARDVIRQVAKECGKKPIVQPEKRVDRNVTLAEALGWAVYGEWGRPFQVPGISLHLGIGTDPKKILARFTRLAREGKLTIWGKRDDPGYFEKIPKSHWKDNRLTIADIFGSIVASGDDPYRELMLNRADVQKEWPHEG